MSYIQLTYKIDFFLSYTIFSVCWFGSIIFVLIKNNNYDKGGNNTKTNR